MSRVNVKGILADPSKRDRPNVVALIVATQAREGIDTTAEQAAEAYERVRNEAYERVRNVRNEARRPLNKRGGGK